MYKHMHKTKAEIISILKREKQKCNLPAVTPILLPCLPFFHETHHTRISQIKGPPCHKKFPCFHEGGFYLAESISIFFCGFFATVYAYYDIKSISESFLSKVPQQFRNL